MTNTTVTTIRDIRMTEQRGTPKNKVERPERSREAVGARLWKIRELAGVNQTKFAKELGFTQNTYSSYETGARMCSLELAAAVCDVHNVTLDYIFLGDDSGLQMHRASALKAINPKR